MTHETAPHASHQSRPGREIALLGHAGRALALLGDYAGQRVTNVHIFVNNTPHQIDNFTDNFRDSPKIDPLISGPAAEAGRGPWR